MKKLMKLDQADEGDERGGESETKRREEDPKFSLRERKKKMRT